METSLEKIALNKRPIEENRNDYEVNDPYSTQHKDALSDGDPLGKGTGSAGHTHSTPDFKKTTISDEGQVYSAIDYANFNTTEGGGLYDIEGRTSISSSGRERNMLINNYGPENQYGAGIIDTTANTQAGQYQASTTTSLKGRDKVAS